MRPMGYGDGSIVRRSDGRLQVSVTIDGRRRYRMVPRMADPKAQQRKAEEALAKLRERRAAGLDPSDQRTAVFLRSWLESLDDARHARVRPRTRDHYRLIVERHIIPALGHHRLERLSERHVQAWLDADPAAPRTVHHHRAVLRRALNVAVRQRLLGRNVALGVELPRVRAFPGAPLTIDEARALLAATAGDRLHALWRLALDTGFRQGELLGLARDDVDTDGGTVAVAAQLQRRAGQWIRVPTKASRTVERIAIGPGTVAALRAHLVRLAAERQPGWVYHGLLFVTLRGEPWHGAAILREFHRACDAADIPRRRFHDLRSTSATLLAEAGVSEAVRMARLGHATEAMSRHYAKVREPLDRDAAARLDAALG